MHIGHYTLHQVSLVFLQPWNWPFCHTSLYRFAAMNIAVSVIWGTSGEPVCQSKQIFNVLFVLYTFLFQTLSLLCLSPWPPSLVSGEAPCGSATIVGRKIKTSPCWRGTWSHISTSSTPALTVARSTSLGLACSAILVLSIRNSLEIKMFELTL